MRQKRPGRERTTGRRLWSLILLPVLWTTTELHSQSASEIPTVILAGIVQDTSGTVVPGARLVLHDNANVMGSEEFTADSKGRFQFQVKPGEYSLKTMAEGFAITTSMIAATVTPTPIVITLNVAQSGCGVCVSIEPSEVPIIDKPLSIMLSPVPAPTFRNFHKTFRSHH